MSLVKDAEKPNLPAAFCHFFCGCVTENSSGNRRSLFPSTCFWRVVFLCSPKVKQDLPGSWRMGFAVLFSLAYLDLSFSCCSWHFPLSKGGGSEQHEGGVKVLHLFMGKPHHSKGGKIGHMTILWVWHKGHAGGVCREHLQHCKGVQNCLTPILRSSPVLGRNKAFQNPFTLHSAYSFLLLSCNALNRFMAQQVACASA